MSHIVTVGVEVRDFDAVRSACRRLNLKEPVCGLAKLFGVSLQEAALNVVPVAATAAESIETLRRWASGRCLDSASPGTYLHRPRTGQRRNLGTARSDGPISPLV
ncbi:MAG: hypothetical protein ACRC46_12620 [Thermoguttaceae bacterium]